MKTFHKQKLTMLPEFKSTIIFTHQKEKIINFLLIKKTWFPMQVYYMEFYHNFFIAYSSIGIVKPKFTRRNEK